MGIHWNCLAADTLSPTSVAAPVPVPVPDLDSDSDSDAPRDSILKLVDVDASPVDSAEFSCCFTMVTSCISTWMSISPLSGENNIIFGVLDNSKFREFTYEELRAATFNFSKNLLLGRGGFGNVYKGWLKEQRLSKGARNQRIAVKRFSGDTQRRYLEFTTEISSLGKLSHPNIIKLLGFCRENEEKILVYEYMPKGTLGYHLFSKKPDRVLSWEIRLKIAMEIAEGLSYLHSLEHPVIHKDLKPANILLDKSYTAKISDFGLAITAPASSQDHDGYIREDGIAGTYGYMDPLYARNGKLHVKSDVYSFGVVLVELLTGLKSMKNITDGSTFEEWTEKYLNNRFRLRGIMDSRLEGKYVTGQASEIAMLALRCLVSNPKFRPSMKEVAETLEKIKTRAYNRKHLVMCGKCHEAGHYTRSCEKISQVGGNSKLPNASEATITEKKTSSTQSTVQQDSERSEASGSITETHQITPSRSNLHATKNEKTSAIQSPHPQQGSKRDEANGSGTNKPKNNHPRKTTAVGGNSKALEARNTAKKDKTSSRLTVQLGNTRKEANGVATSPSCNSAPKTKIPSKFSILKNEKTSAIQSPHPQQGSKRDEANRIGTNKPRNNHPGKTTAVGGNSKALEARNKTKKEKTSSSRLTVQQGITRKEANGVATSPSCNSAPKTKIPSDSKLLDTAGATTEEKISTTKSVVRQGKKRNETNGVVTSTTRSKGPKKINTSMSELPNASNVARKVKAQSTVQQVNKRNVPTLLKPESLEMPKKGVSSDFP